MTKLRFLLLGISLLGCAFVVLPLDLRIARALSGESRLPGDLKRLVRLSEVFAHGLGVAMLLITALVLDWKNRRGVVIAGANAYLCGGIANLAKMIIGRSRPHETDLSLSNVSDSFGSWLPILGEQPWTHAMQSFPSAHTATGVGFAVGLAYAYPQGRVWFACLACLAAFQRMECGAHFFSDVVAGAAIALLACTIVIPNQTKLIVAEHQSR